MKTASFVSSIRTLFRAGLVCAGLLSAGAAFADDRGGPGDRGDEHQARASHSPPAPAAGTSNRAELHHFPPGYYLNRPLGSATNAPRGYYRDHLSYDPPPREHGHDHEQPVYLPQPVYYVVPPLFPDESRLSFGETRGPDDAIEPGSTEPVVIKTDNVYVLSPEREPAAEPDRTWTPRAAPSNDAYRDEAPAPPQASRGDAPEPAAPGPPQPVTLRIEPADAIVWLDDEELGRAGNLAGLLHLEPGVYLLEVEHNELAAQRLFFGVVDQPVDVRVDLGATEPRRRFRVR